VAKFLIVDAHSVLFAWPELRSLHARRNALAREALVRLLTGYQDTTGTRVVAVFDGQGAKPQEVTEPGGIQVFYSASGQTADSVIERLVAVYASRHEITVATADRLERQTATSLGGETISPELLRLLLEEAELDLRRELQRHRKK